MAPPPPRSPVDHHAHQLAPSICITGVMFSEGFIPVTRSLENGDTIQATLRYRIFRPRQQHMLPAPLVVLHGGPGVPSNYLINVVNVITDRCVIFYDQLGCGKSSRVVQKEAYSIDGSVDDLEKLLKHWKLRNYHLLGHSFGGILAFEYLKKLPDEKCLSVTLSSVPPDIQVAKAESHRLLHEECEGDKAIFSQTHECRVVPCPLALQDAYAASCAVWRGVQAIPNYKATLLGDGADVPIETPCYILRGQYDMITRVDEWQDFFRTSQMMVLAGCSHHALLENEQLFGGVLGGFLDDHDL